MTSRENNLQKKVHRGGGGGSYAYDGMVISSS